ncbi:uncharacterized protein LOC129958819 [Argiope bruennichi]|uniref:Uncharacterized protein n=1 Tax=Argiope bruennichi TaxID=94029 RepID=A0A8T0F8B6_ARGBR|nr:uncharacterized protein LOC129958819 [Argiope bruennichi]KAF8785650.1 hypothetical protein HNY73_011165 [Argiope bruennichi]
MSSSHSDEENPRKRAEVEDNQHDASQPDATEQTGEERQAQNVPVSTQTMREVEGVPFFDEPSTSSAPVEERVLRRSKRKASQLESVAREIKRQKRNPGATKKEDPGNVKRPVYLKPGLPNVRYMSDKEMEDIFNPKRPVPKLKVLVKSKRIAKTTQASARNVRTTKKNRPPPRRGMTMRVRLPPPRRGMTMRVRLVRKVKKDNESKEKEQPSTPPTSDDE